jgi:hypothetical protein
MTTNDIPIGHPRGADAARAYVDSVRGHIIRARLDAVSASLAAMPGADSDRAAVIADQLAVVLAAVEGLCSRLGVPVTAEEERLAAAVRRHPAGSGQAVNR